MYSLLLLSLVSFTIALILTPVCRALAFRFDLVDALPIPRIGGVAIAVAYLSAYGFIWIFGLSASQILRDNLQLILRLLLAGLIVFAVGLAGDLFRLKPWQKLAGLLIASIFAVWSGVRITGIAGLHLPLWCAWPVSVLWLIGCANAFNLIDGLDGLAAGVGFLAALTTLIAALVQHNIPLVLATVPLVGGLLGFLRYNFSPASIFLGDSGSLLIGFLLGCYGILWSEKSATVLGITAPLIALSIPLVDTGLAMARRFLRLQPIFGADRSHIHHKLLGLGFTPRRVTWLIYGACAVCACLSLLQSVLHEQFAGAIVVLFCVGICIGIQRLGYSEFGAVGNMVMTGTFRRLLNTRLQLDEFRKELKAASTADECWGVIQPAYCRFGFTEVLLKLGENVYEHTTNGPHAAGSWTLSLPLADSGSIMLSRKFDAPAPPMGAAFADVVGDVLSHKDLNHPANAPESPRATQYFQVGG